MALYYKNLDRWRFFLRQSIKISNFNSDSDISGQLFRWNFSHIVLSMMSVISAQTFEFEFMWFDCGCWIFWLLLKAQFFFIDLIVLFLVFYGNFLVISDTIFTELWILKDFVLIFITLLDGTFKFYYTICILIKLWIFPTIAMKLSGIFGDFFHDLLNSFYCNASFFIYFRALNFFFLFRIF